MNGYELSRVWFDFCFENTEKITPAHTALYFYCIEHCNRLGWKEKFGLPAQISMEAIGVKSWKTYSKVFNDIVEWKFIEVIQKSQNQYTATVIALVKNTKANAKAGTTALSKAIQNHAPKQVQSIVGINKPYNLITTNLITTNLKTENGELNLDFIEEGFLEVIMDWLEYKKQRGEEYVSQKSIEVLYDSMVNISAGNAKIAKLIVEQSMVKNWAGFFPLKTEDKQPSNSSFEYEKNQEEEILKDF